MYRVKRSGESTVPCGAPVLRKSLKQHGIQTMMKIVKKPILSKKKTLLKSLKICTKLAKKKPTTTKEKQSCLDELRCSRKANDTDKPTITD